VVGDLRTRLADRWMCLELTEDARRSLAGQGFDPVHGARPLRRSIARRLETRIGRALVSGEVEDGATIRVDATDDELVVTWDDVAGTEDEAAWRR